MFWRSAGASVADSDPLCAEINVCKWGLLVRSATATRGQRAAEKGLGHVPSGFRAAPNGLANLTTLAKRTGDVLGGR
jgi:hypothetical protein